MCSAAQAQQPTSNSSAHTQIRGVVLAPADIMVYQYKICPFCNKLKAVMDYLGVPYQTTEVNPLTKKEIKFSKDYKKVTTVLFTLKKWSYELALASVLPVHECCTLDSYACFVRVKLSKSSNLNAYVRVVCLSSAWHVGAYSETGWSVSARLSCNSDSTTAAVENTWCNITANT
jgi:Glutaredoxin